MHSRILDRHLRTYLFSTGNILAAEEAAEHALASDAVDEEAVAASDGSLPIGDLKGATT